MAALNKINFEFPMWENVDWPKREDEKDEQVKELLSESEQEVKKEPDQDTDKLDATGDTDIKDITGSTLSLPADSPKKKKWYSSIGKSKSKKKLESPNSELPTNHEINHETNGFADDYHDLNQDVHTEIYQNEPRAGGSNAATNNGNTSPTKKTKSKFTFNSNNHHASNGQEKESNVRPRIDSTSAPLAGEDTEIGNSQNASPSPVHRNGTPGAEAPTNSFFSFLSGSPTTKEPKQNHDGSDDKNTLADVVEEVMHKSSLSAATSNESTQEEKKEKKILYPIKGVPYTLDINLREGANLIAKDLSGTSDPYVKFRYNNKLLYKSATIYRDLRPRWYEKFSLNIEDVSKFLYLKVYDYDFALKDDFMGEAYVDMATLELEKITEIKLKLEDPNAAGKDLGYLLLTLTLTPKREMKEAKSKSLISTLTRGKSKKKIETSGVVDITTKKPRSQHSCDCVLNVVLLEGKNLMAMDDNGKSDPYCKLRIGNEKFKSKTCSKTLNPVWKEEYEFHIYYDQTTIFELEVYDYDMASKDDFMGKVELDVLALPKEDTVRMELELEGGEGLILLLLTLTGFNDGNNMTDEDLAGKEVTDPKRIEDLEDKYALSKTFKDKADIGYLIMKVIRAKELPAADFGGNSDPFVIAEVRNRRIQTPTVYKTINPEWGKVYQFGIKDIHDIVKISVYDEDKAKKEFLGKCMIPLLDVESGVRKWHNLKDRKFRDKAKGQIEIEMTVVYNPIRAALRTFKPREEYFLEEEIKFKRQLLVRNLKRVGGLVKAIVSFGGSIKDLFEWKRKSRSAIAFMIYIFICLNFDWFFLPVMLLITFAYHYIKYSLMGSAYFDLGEEEEEDDDDEETEDANKKGKESKSLKAKLQALYDVCQTVQNVLNKVASFGERVKNTFNWTVPWLSMLMVIVLSIVTVIFYIIPIRYIFLAWGIKKFTRKIIKPNHIPNNELMDFLSRIPSDEELILLRDSSVQDEKDTKKKR